MKAISLMVVAATAVLGVSACGSAAPSPSSSAGGQSSSAGASNDNVVIKNFAFTPATVQVTTGATVTWMNSDSAAHTTTADKSSAMAWDSGSLSQNQTYAVTFTKPGSYSFHCAIHNYMTGTITVSG